jgi:RNA polymerase sigma-70 factor (ECF subfamily)
MSRTPASLLDRLREPSDQSAWSTFVNLYSPLIYRWARHAGLGADDAFDLVQDVFVVLIEKMPEFRYDESKSFRAWLRTVTLNKWRDRCRASMAAKKLPLPDSPIAPPDPAWFDDTQYRQQLVSRAMETLKREVQPATWQAFQECAIKGRRAREVAAELGLSVNAVYLARSRVLQRLREELDGLLD